MNQVIYRLLDLWKLLQRIQDLLNERKLIIRKQYGEWRVYIRKFASLDSRIRKLYIVSSVLLIFLQISILSVLLGRIYIGNVIYTVEQCPLQSDWPAKNFTIVKPRDASGVAFDMVFSERFFTLWRFTCPAKFLFFLPTYQSLHISRMKRIEVEIYLLINTSILDFLGY